MAKLSTKVKTTISLSAIRGAIRDCAFKPSEQPMKTFIEVSLDRKYLINRAKEELEVFLTSGEKKSLIFAIRLLLIAMVA